MVHFHMLRGLDRRLHRAHERPLRGVTSGARYPAHASAPVQEYLGSDGRRVRGIPVNT